MRTRDFKFVVLWGEWSHWTRRGAWFSCEIYRNFHCSSSWTVCIW